MGGGSAPSRVTGTSGSAKRSPSVAGTASLIFFLLPNGTAQCRHAYVGIMTFCRSHSRFVKWVLPIFRFCVFCCCCYVVFLFLFLCVCVCVLFLFFVLCVCVCVCVCERERERERESVPHTHTHTHTGCFLFLFFVF